VIKLITIAIQWTILYFSSTTKTGCHDIAEILLKVVLSTINQIKSNLILFTGSPEGEVIMLRNQCIYGRGINVKHEDENI
jgi:hypothetical protein